MIVVSSYNSPDIDGIACSIAYAKLLNKLGKGAKATYFGDLSLEVNFVKKFTNVFPVEKHCGKYDVDTKFVIVDTADPTSIESAVKPEKVIEIFDHRQLTYADKFVNAKCTIQQVGSCATLITEEFQKNGITPSENSAIYLYSAIISNTINFKNTVTTERDIDAADWLKKFMSLPSDYIKQMFDSKSKVDSSNLYEVLDQDFAIKTFGDKKVGIAQIEITNLEERIKSWGNKLPEILEKFRKDNNLDYVFFSGIDIFEGFNIFYVVDENSRELFSKVLGIPNLESGYRTKEIIMRKQIWPKVEELLKN
jgi:inorganic pyrophosphatase/exopolyphosphatase